MDKPNMKQRLRETVENLLQLHESKNLSECGQDLLRRSIIKLEQAKMELNKWKLLKHY